jgi:hypothetical protein
MKTRIYIIIYFLFATIEGNAQTVASFTVLPSSASCGITMQFDANSSTVSSSHNIVKYEWDFDYDGVTFDIQASGVVVEHAYSRMNTYTVALRVTDDSDPAETDISTENATLLFTNHAPVAHAGNGYFSARVNDIPAYVFLNAKDSYDPDSPCDKVVAYLWDTDGDGLYGSEDVDGSPYCSSTSDCEGAVISIRNPDWYPGDSETIGLVVVDSYGLRSSRQETTIEVSVPGSCPSAINELNIHNVVSGDAYFELKVSHPEEAAQTFDCVFTILPDGDELEVYDTNDNILTQIDYAGNNVNQSVIGYFDATAYPDDVNRYRLQVTIKTSDSRNTVKVTRTLSIDNTPPVNPVSCSNFGTASGNCTNDNDPYFVWSEATDNYSNVLDYYYYWGTDLSGESSENLATYNGYDPDPLMADGTYYLRINTVDEAGNEAGWATLYTYKYFDYKYIDTDTICDGDSLLWHEDYYKTAGTYYDSLTTINGCDSIFELNLFINPSPSSFIITGLNTVTENQIEIYFVPNNSSVNYKWDIQNGNITNQISNDTSEIHWNTANLGYIYVIAEDQNGCVSDTAKLEVTIGTTGFNTLFNNSNIIIYPNPVKNIIYVDYNKEFLMEIYNILGEQIIISKRNETNVANLKTGTYIILIKNKENKLIKINKLVKE